MSALLDIVLGAVAEPVMHTLLHFLWQGSLVALGLAGLLLVFRPRRAEVRYRWACAALLLMVVLPMVTGARFMINRSNAWGGIDRSAPVLTSTIVTGAADHDPTDTPWETSAAIKHLARAVPVADTSSGVAGDLLRQVALRVEDPQTARWILFAWLVGVFLLSIAHMGGWIRVQQLRRLQVEPVAPRWQQEADRLCEAMGFKKGVRVLRSAAVQVPAVIGWLKPVVLLPVSALSGLPTKQLECLLAHELAHIWRRDYLVNLLQICAETLLFYHPAVWWVSRQIRDERENCCDDIAAAVTGDRLLYARALVDLEELRLASPRLALGADGGSLLLRVKRLIGGPEMSLQNSRHLLSGTLAVLLILAGGSVLALAAQAQLQEAVFAASTTALTEDARRGRWFAERVGDELDLELRNRSDRSDQHGRHRGSWNSHQRIAVDEFTDLDFGAGKPFALRREAGIFGFSGDFDGEEGSGSFTFSPDPKFVDELEDLGTKGLSGNELMVLAMQDLEIAAVSKLRDMGYGPFDGDELVTVAIFEVTPAYIDAMKDLGYDDISLDDLVALRVHDVNTDYVKAMREAFGDLDSDDLLAMKIHDVTPEYAAALAAEGIDVDSADDLLSYRIHGVTSHYVDEIRGHLGHDMQMDDILSYKIHGISAAHIEHLKGAGFDDMDGDDVLAWKIHDVSPEFIEETRALGYELDSEELLAWRIHGVDAAYIEALAELGYKDIDADDLVALRIHGATPKWIKHLHDKGLDDLDVDDLVRLRISGVEL